MCVFTYHHITHTHPFAHSQWNNIGTVSKERWCAAYAKNLHHHSSPISRTHNARTQSESQHTSINSCVFFLRDCCNLVFMQCYSDPFRNVKKSVCVWNKIVFQTIWIAEEYSLISLYTNSN